MERTGSCNCTKSEGFDQKKMKSQCEAVSMIMTHYSAVQEVQEQLTDTSEGLRTRLDFGALSKTMKSFLFVRFLGFLGKLLREISDAQQYLQTKDIDLYQCIVKIAA